MLEWKSDGWKERKSCVSSACRLWFKERDETRVLSGVIRDKEQRAENWALGTPHHRVCGEEKLLLHLTREQPEER